MERASLISTPMFSGTSTPRSARITSPKNVQLVKLSPVAALGE